MAFSFSRILLPLGGYFSSSRLIQRAKRKMNFFSVCVCGFVTRQKGDQEAGKRRAKYLTVSGADRSCCLLLLWAVEEFLKSIFSNILSWERDRSRVSTNAFKSAILRRFVPPVPVFAMWLPCPLLISCSLRSVCSGGDDPVIIKPIVYSFNWNAIKRSGLFMLRCML